MTAPHTDRLAYQACADCGAAQTLPRMACTRCGSERLEGRTSRGLGVVLAVTVVSRAPSDTFRPLVPYTLVLVTLDEGPQVMGHAEPGVAIGDAVRADRFEHAGENLLVFRRTFPVVPPAS